MDKRLSTTDEFLNRLVRSQKEQGTILRHIVMIRQSSHEDAVRSQLKTIAGFLERTFLLSDIA